MLNHIDIAGRLTKDVELRRTNAGKAVASFTLAVDRDFGKNENGENVIVSHGKIGSRKYYKLTTAQNNGWTRYNYVYEDGDAEESFAKG